MRGVHWPGLTVTTYNLSSTASKNKDDNRYFIGCCNEDSRVAMVVVPRVEDEFGCRLESAQGRTAQHGLRSAPVQPHYRGTDSSNRG
jgi:hypothetical protein